jgi:hypothetical protein
VKGIFAALVLVLTLQAAHAQDIDQGEIITQFWERVDHLGAAVVKTCVDMDVEAAGELSAYPKTAQAIIESCRARVSHLGWAVVQTCADMDLEAERELQELEHSE